MKNINARISAQAITALGQRFRKSTGKPNPTGGAAYVLESWAVLHRRFVTDTKGLFSRGELMAIVDVMSNHALAPRFTGQSVEVGLQESIQFDGLDGKWGLDAQNFLARVKSLTPDQRSHLEIWAKSHREPSPAISTGDELEAHISALI